ncbi:MAG TPA: hypothetical protein VEQ15_08130 [Myxococcales bacterium]|jgi:hypothetical protein|nr:hypothetical protein [Myxococcales bacterium]
MLRLHDVSLTRLPPLHDVREAVGRDVRGLWAGVEALGLHELPAANEPTFAPRLERVMQRGWRPPLGWISLAAAGALLAGLGFAQMKVQRHLTTAVRAEPQKARASKQKKLPRARIVERTAYSRGT